MSAQSAFFLARADDFARDAASTDLPNVRERCLRAEAAFRAMADRQVRSDGMRAAAAAKTAQNALHL